jgi:Protein of unknown function (DUF3168)
VADFQAGLFTWLMSQPPIAAHVGSRIYPLLAPATAALPFLTYQRIGEQEEAHLTGLSGLTRATYQFDVWGATADQAETALLAVKLAMDMYRGVMGNVPVRQFSISSILDGLEPPSEGQTMGIFRHTITADVWWHEPV